jgi:hypothetical protein
MAGSQIGIAYDRHKDGECRLLFEGAFERR